MDGPLAVAASPFSTTETEVLQSYVESQLAAEIALLHAGLAFYEKLQALIKKNLFFFCSHVHMYSEQVFDVKELGSKIVIVNTRKHKKNHDLLSNF